MPIRTSDQSRTELNRVLSACKPGFVGIGVLTVVIGMLPIAAAIYALMIFDVALAGRSGATLIGLLLIILAVYGMQTLLEVVRAKMLAQIGESITFQLDERVETALSRAADTGAVRSGDGLEAARHLDSVRHFLSGRAAAAFIDLPAVVIAVAFLVVLDIYLALALFVFVAILAVIVIRSVRATSADVIARTALIADRGTFSGVGTRHGGVIRVLGMRSRAAHARATSSLRLVQIEHKLAGLREARLAAAVTRVAQAGILAIGAWLVVDGKASAGVIVAASLLVERVLRPFEDAVSGANLYSAARQGWREIGAILSAVPPPQPHLILPAPARSLAAEAVTLAYPGTRRMVIQDISFSLNAGDALAVIGPSGSGKSTLLRGLVGELLPIAGKVRLDGGAIDQWESDPLGKHIGYMPQSIELFDGTIAQNIARFDPEATSDALFEAAKAAGAHDMIVRLPDGYATEVGASGALLAMGQRQQIAMARAVFGNPFLIAFDEPAAYADGSAHAALRATIAAARERGAIVITTGNSPTSIDAANLILVLRDGRVQDFGSKDDVRARLLQSRATVDTAQTTAEARSGGK